MTRILDRLVAATFLKLFFLFLLASPPLFILGDITENLAGYIDRGLTGTEVAKAYLYQLPLFIQWSFPIAALVAAVFTVHNMTTHRELVAAKAGGVSFHRVVRPILVLGLLLTVVALGMTDVVPRGKRIAAQILKAEDPRANFRSDFVYESKDGTTTWQVGHLTAADGRMNNVTIERPPTDSLPAMYLKANMAMHDSTTGWTFLTGSLRFLRADSTEEVYDFERLRMPSLTERPDELLEAPREPDEMTYAELGDLANAIERSGGNPGRLWVKREQKLSIPVATLVVILFGVPLATSTQRGGTAYGVGVSLATTMVYLLLFKVAAAMGAAGTISADTAAWFPNILFAGAAAGLLVRVRT